MTARAATALAFLAWGSIARADGLELGVENILSRSRPSAINRDNALGLADTENLFRVTADARAGRGWLSGRVAGYVERRGGSARSTDIVARQMYVEAVQGQALRARLGRQRLSWGSGFTWNPTGRFEPPRSFANPGAEQPGIDALRLDLTTSGRIDLTFAVGRADQDARDLPGVLGDDPRRSERAWTAAWRARFLAGATDVSLVAVAGVVNDGLFGIDLVRTAGPVVWHVEAAAGRTGEIERASPRGYARVVAGGLWTVGETAVAAEYFWNGDGFDGSEFTRFKARLDAAYATASNPATPAAARRIASASYAQDARVPFGGHLGLRRHYASASISRSGLGPSLALTMRAVAGLTDGGLVLVPALAYSPGRNVRVNVDVIVLVGPEDSEYRMAPSRVAIQARARYTF